MKFIKESLLIYTAEYSENFKLQIYIKLKICAKPFSGKISTANTEKGCKQNKILNIL